MPDPTQPPFPAANTLPFPTKSEFWSTIPPTPAPFRFQTPVDVKIRVHSAQCSRSAKSSFPERDNNIQPQLGSRQGSGRAPRPCRAQIPSVRLPRLRIAPSMNDNDASLKRRYSYQEGSILYNLLKIKDLIHYLSFNCRNQVHPPFFQERPIGSTCRLRKDRSPPHSAERIG